MSSIRPVGRLDEALKQISIANEHAELDIAEALQTASEALESARATLAADD